MADVDSDLRDFKPISGWYCPKRGLFYMIFQKILVLLSTKSPIHLPACHRLPSSLRGNCTSNQNWAYFVLSQNHNCKHPDVNWLRSSKMALIVAGHAILDFLIKTVCSTFRSITQESLGLLKFLKISVSQKICFRMLELLLLLLLLFL